MPISATQTRQTRRRGSIGRLPISRPRPEKPISAYCLTAPGRSADSPASRPGWAPDNHTEGPSRSCLRGCGITTVRSKMGSSGAKTSREFVVDGRSWSSKRRQRATSRIGSRNDAHLVRPVPAHVHVHPPNLRANVNRTECTLSSAPTVPFDRSLLFRSSRP